MAEIAEDISGSHFDSLVNLIFSGAFLSILLEYMLPATAIAIVISVLAGGFVFSAEYGANWQAVGGSHVGVSEVMANFVEKWRQMAWTQFLSYFLTFLPLVAGLLALAGVIVLRASLLFVVLAALAVPAGIVLTVVFSLLFVYTPVTVISENLSGLAAIKRSWHQVRRNAGISATYGVVYILLSGPITFIVSLIPVANLPLSSLASFGILIMVTPVLHLTKTAIYAEMQKSESVKFEVYESFLKDLSGSLPRFLWRIFIKGLIELKNFALDVRNVIYHVLSASAVLIGLFLGSWIASKGLTQAIYGLGYVPGKMNSFATNSIPLALSVYIFLHNWQVSLATALSGVWLSVAPFTTLVLNGVILGVVSDLIPNKVMLLAALVPHGVIEVPSFVLAGSAGIKLGVAFSRSRRDHDQESTLEFHNVARQTVYIAVGLALLFFIAGLIESNVTPVIMRMAGWG